MSMNRRIQAPPSGDSEGGSDSSDLTGKDIAIMLAVAVVVVFIFGTLAMDGDDSSGASDDDMSRFSNQADQRQQRLDIDADEGYVRPGEAAGPRTGELDPAFDPHQISARDIDEERLREGDYRGFGAPASGEVPEFTHEDQQVLDEWGAGFDDAPTSWQEANQMGGIGAEAPSIDELESSMPSEVRHDVDFNEARRDGQRR